MNESFFGDSILFTDTFPVINNGMEPRVTGATKNADNVNLRVKQDLL